MFKKIGILLLVFLLLQYSYAVAAPKTVMISTSSSSSWLPSAINKTACEIVDHYLMNNYDIGVFDGSKTSDKRAMSKRIGKGMDYVVYIELTGFYDPPYTTAHLNSNISPADTVSSVMLEYNVYISASGKWIKDRVNHQVVYPQVTVPLEAAYPEAVKQTMPKLNDALASIIK